MRRWLGWMVASVVFGALAVFIALGAAGAGHGTYVPAAILFPYTMSIAVLVGSIAPLLVALALAQYPIYGALVAHGRNTRRVWIGLACVHVGSVAVALFLMNRNGDFW